MDTRDKYLHRHMKKRKSISAELPTSVQLTWARKCIEKAASQQRNLFYIMASMWLLGIEKNITEHAYS